MGWSDHLRLRHQPDWAPDVETDIAECARDGRSLADFHAWNHREYGEHLDHRHDEHGRVTYVAEAGR